MAEILFRLVAITVSGVVLGCTLPRMILAMRAQRSLARR